MKKIILRLVFVICMMTLFAGCKDIIFPIWDFQPAVISIVVENSAGENLLDPETDGNILDNGITVTYDGEEYPMEELDVATRYYPATWYGLGVMTDYGRDPNGEEGIRALLLGEFYVDTQDGYHREPFTINWGDGTSDEITFDLYTKYNRKGTEANIYRKIWLNGELQSDNSLDITIVK